LRSWDGALPVCRSRRRSPLVRSWPRPMRSQLTRCYGISGFRGGSGSCCRARACSTTRPRCGSTRAAVLAAAGSFSLVADAPILVLAAVSGGKRACARPGKQHRSAIGQHVWGVASVRASGVFTDHHGCDLRHDIGSSGSRALGRAPAHHSYSVWGDRGLRRERAGVRVDGVASSHDYRAPVTGATLGLASVRAERACPS